ncbi:hypothetical protein D3C75_1158740 [compost metagenome]
MELLWFERFQILGHFFIFLTKRNGICPFSVLLLNRYIRALLYQISNHLHIIRSCRYRERRRFVRIDHIRLIIVDVYPFT